ncbi:hypothetical protein ALC60_12319 [Trachymyrmex zeteki]|uniref:DUF4817 domain-containing protein n=1 Tax=Mycetomoellerius zeteki TaxID=64791 RepID=A0A151WL99_9HYME|nr:hypothetical protein ALC60_12319 [Trachymyrmex zeteki]
MPRTYSNSEYADMVFVYGFCNGNALKAVREYARRFPNRRVPNRRVFMLTFNRLRETGTFSIRQENNRFQAALRRDLQAGNRILQHFDNHPETSVRNASAVLGVSPQTKETISLLMNKLVWETWCIMKPWGIMGCTRYLFTDMLICNELSDNSYC